MMDSVPFAGLARPALTASHVEVSESVYPAGFGQPLNSHEPVYVTAVLSGGYHERAGNTGRDIEAGALLFHAAGETHTVRFLGHQTTVFRLRPLAPMLEAERLSRAAFETT